MTARPRLSVVVASHGRPAALRTCLQSLAQNEGTDFEVIVIADAEGLAAAATLPFAERLETALQAEPNLSRARNDGIALAAGEVVAFIDDDAVAEPTWTGRILAAFAGDATCAAVTGPVIGRNGISLQWGGMAVDRLGRDLPLDPPDAAPPAAAARKLHGTNMAVRRDILLSLGGFDPALHFYLDDTDMALRLADAGHRGHWLPLARVHHGFAASARRNGDRVPLRLHEIGASTAVFLRKHAPRDMDAALDSLVADQRARLFRLARRRKLGPREIEFLMGDLRSGIAAGLDRTAEAPGIPPQDRAFAPLRSNGGGPDIVIGGWRMHAANLRREAQRLTADGARVTLMLFEPSPRAHRMTFVEGGWWEQTGGLWGRSDRTSPRLQAWRPENRLKAEAGRISATRFVYPPDVRGFGTGGDSLTL